MPLRLEVCLDAAAAAEAAARCIADRVAAAAASGLRLAVSGGSTPAPMFAWLGSRDDLPWSGVEVWQVDERLAPAGPDRNASMLDGAFLSKVRFHPMPVGQQDPERAASAYSEGLPERFDLIHLGLGADGHTASLVPGDPTATVRDRNVAVTAPYEGHRRMTLTAPVIEGASEVMFLVSGADKAQALARLMAGDTAIPAGALRLRDATVFCDLAAAGERRHDAGAAGS